MPIEIHIAGLVIYIKLLPSRPITIPEDLFLVSLTYNAVPGSYQPALLGINLHIITNPLYKYVYPARK